MIHDALRRAGVSTRAGTLFALGVALAIPPQQSGGRIRRAIAERRAARQEQGTLDDGAGERGRAVVPRGVRVTRDVAYGADPKQRLDVYAPANARNAPVILMVHGGGWRIGDKGAKSVVENKVKRWTAAGMIVISVNYRLLPNADPIEQARDVARALAYAQRHMASWGGDADRITLMGHSAGAHLVALLTANPSLATSLGARPWLGTVILDSAALDVVQTMEQPHLPLYTQAFGTDRAFWRAASPYEQLSRGAAPMLAVCSSLRRDSCPAAAKFAAKAKTLGARAAVLEEAKSHREINEQLGEPGAYTDAVEDFLRTLDPSLVRR